VARQQGLEGGTVDQCQLDRRRFAQVRVRIINAIEKPLM
jgi:hypothetical protein